jgi:predicted nucleotidyltransferase
MKIHDIRNLVFPLCEEFGVRRLDAFGFIGRGSSQALSDIDLLVEFVEPERYKEHPIALHISC